MSRQADGGKGMRASASSDERTSANSPPKSPPSGSDKGPGFGVTSRVAVRVAIFIGIAFIPYLIFQKITEIVFSPRLEIVRTTIPEGTLSPEEPVRVAIEVKNDRRMDGAALVVAVMQNGQLIEGPTVDVPGKDSAEAYVDLDLPPGDHVFTLILYDAFRGVERLTTMSGLRVAVRPRGLEVGALTLSSQRSPSGLTVEVRFAAENRGYREETVTPVVLFDPVLGGPELEALGPVFLLAPGEHLDVRFQVSPALPSTGLFFARVQLVSEDGVNLGHTRFPAALEVTPTGAVQR